MVTKTFLIQGTTFTVSLEQNSADTYLVNIASNNGSKPCTVSIVAFESSESNTLIDSLLIKLNHKKFYKAKIIEQEKYSSLISFLHSKAEFLVEESPSPHSPLVLFPALSEQTIQKKELTHSLAPTNSLTVGEITNALKSPLGGRIIKVLVQEGELVIENQPLCVIESMKMENEICSPYTAHIKTLFIAQGNVVQPSQVLIIFEKKGEYNATAQSEYQQKEV